MDDRAAHKAEIDALAERYSEVSDGISVGVIVPATIRLLMKLNEQMNAEQTGLLVWTLEATTVALKKIQAISKMEESDG